jgi:hypothetical protein
LPRQFFIPTQQSASPTALHVFSFGNNNGNRNSRARVSSSSASSTVTSTDRTGRRRRKTVADRTQEEAISLMRDVVRAAVEAGPRAGPQRTLQAYRAFATTLREYLPQIVTARSTEELNRKFPQILRTLMERMGSTYVKLGQFIASSPVRTLNCCIALVGLFLGNVDDGTSHVVVFA